MTFLDCLRLLKEKEIQTTLHLGVNKGWKNSQKATEADNLIHLIKKMFGNVKNLLLMATFR